MWFEVIRVVTVEPPLTHPMNPLGGPGIRVTSECHRRSQGRVILIVLLLPHRGMKSTMK